MSRDVTLRRALLLASIGLVVCLLPFLAGLVGALILFVLLRPAQERLARVLPPRTSAFVIAVLAAIVLLIPGTWLATTVIAEARVAITTFQQARAWEWLTAITDDEARWSRSAEALTSSLVAWLSGKAFALFGSVTALVLNAVLALFGVYYLLVDGRRFLVHFRHVLPMSDATVTRLSDRFVGVTEALMLGTVLTALVQGVVVGVTFAVLGLHPAILWGFVTACVSVLPVLGSSLVWVPGAVTLALQQHPGQALLLALIGVTLASNIDNVVRLFVFRRVSGIHPMLTLVGAFAGVRFLGVIGAFLGPLLLSYFFELVTLAEDSSCESTPY